MVNQKLERFADALKDILNFRLGAGSVVKAYDTNSDVYLTITESSKVNGIIKLVTYPAPASGATDGLGLTQRVYTPHIAQFVYDAGAEADGTGAISEKAKVLAIAELSKLGVKVEVYSEEVGATDVDVGDIADATLVVAFESLEWGLLAGI